MIPQNKVLLTHFKIQHKTKQFMYRRALLNKRLLGQKGFLKRIQIFFFQTSNIDGIILNIFLYKLLKLFRFPLIIWHRKGNKNDSCHLSVISSKLNWKLKSEKKNRIKNKHTDKCSYLWSKFGAIFFIRLNTNFHREEHFNPSCTLWDNYFFLNCIFKCIMAFFDTMYIKSFCLGCYYFTFSLQF